MEVSLPPEIEQDLDSCAAGGGGGVRGSELIREEGKEREIAGGRRTGFRPAGMDLERMWPAHSISSGGRVEGRMVKRDGRESVPARRTWGGIKILPVEVSSRHCFICLWALVCVV